MKITKISTLLLFIAFSASNAKTLLITKPTAEKVRLWSMILAAADIFSKNYVNLPEKKIYNSADFKLKLFDRLLVEIDIPKKLDFLQFDIPNDSHISINPIILTSNIFASAQEKTVLDENILIPMLELYLRIENLNQNKNIQKDILIKIEPEVLIAEKLLEIVCTKALDATMKNQKLLKRISRIIILTAISTGGAHLRRVLAKYLIDKNIEKDLPKIETVAVDTFAQKLITELFAELLQRYIIEDPKKQKLKEKKKKFQQKLEDIIAATNGNKNSANKSSDKEKNHL